MLVRVSKNYAGTFGLFDPETNSIRTKTNASASFEMDDALALRHIDNGILVAADADESALEASPVAEAPVAEAPVESIPETNDEPAEESDELESMSYQDLRKEAKKMDINTNGMTKDEIIEAIREKDAIPEITAQEPV